MFSIGNEELENCAQIEGSILCPLCNKEHGIKFGKVKKEDGSYIESSSIGFYECNRKLYLGSIDGKNVTNKFKN